jgi:hypothetical protein
VRYNDSPAFKSRVFVKSIAYMRLIMNYCLIDNCCMLNVYVQAAAEAAAAFAATEAATDDAAKATAVQPGA